MFERKEVFVESWPPNEMPGRERQLTALSSVLEPVAEGDRVEDCWEFGPSGVGKTATARYLLEELEMTYGTPSVRVECVGKTHWQLLQAIASAHPRAPTHDGMGVDALLEVLEANVTDPFVVVLDEFDGLEAREVLTELHDLEQVALICIGHDVDDALAMVPKPAESLRHARQISFKPYDMPAMLDILQARVDVGLRPGTVTTAQLERIADHVAGSARFGVQALRSAVELGVDRGHTEVTDKDVNDCFTHAKARIRRQLLASLSRQHHIVYRVIREAGPDGLTSGEIYEAYERRSENPRSRQMVGNYRQKLRRYDLVDCEGRTRNNRWWVVDEHLTAPLREMNPD